MVGEGFCERSAGGSCRRNGFPPTLSLAVGVGGPFRRHPPDQRHAALKNGEGPGYRPFSCVRAASREATTCLRRSPRYGGVPTYPEEQNSFSASRAFDGSTRFGLAERGSYGTDVQRAGSSVVEVEVLRRPLLEPEPVLLGHVLEELRRFLEHVLARAPAESSGTSRDDQSGAGAPESSGSVGGRDLELQRLLGKHLVGLGPLRKSEPARGGRPVGETRSRAPKEGRPASALPFPCA